MKGMLAASRSWSSERLKRHGNLDMLIAEVWGKRTSSRCLLRGSGAIAEAFAETLFDLIPHLMDVPRTSIHDKKR
jgi:hypothetical protein